MKTYTVKADLTPDELRAIYALLTETGYMGIDYLLKRVKQAIDKLNSDENPRQRPENQIDF